jgi:hypothetical protein
VNLGKKRGGRRMMATVKDECDKASRAVEQNEVGVSVGCMWPEMPRPRGLSSCRRVRRRSNPERTDSRSSLL